MARAKKVGWRRDRPGGVPGCMAPPPRKSHVRVPTPGACGLDLIRKRVFAHGQVEVGSLGRALVP